MSDESTAERHERLAEAMGTTLDPLAELEPKFESSGVDPYELFVDDVIEGRTETETTVNHYRAVFRQFADYMEEHHDRHPACPNTEQVRQFLRHELDVRGNAISTTRGKYYALNAAYKWFQTVDSLDYPIEYNPFAEAEDKLAWGEQESKEKWPLTQGQIRAAIAENTNIKDRLVVALGLKLGLRQGEVRNIQLQDFHLSNPDVQAHYPEMGTNPMLTEENAIYVPPSSERTGNKSKRPRVLPLDVELRPLLIRYLLIRPDAGEPWLLLTEQEQGHYEEQDGLNPMWRRVFSEYDETARYERITSHFGRHYFTTHFKRNSSLDRIDIQYMRGDLIGRGYNRQSMDEYLHSSYATIKEPYLDAIYDLGL